LLRYLPAINPKSESGLKKGLTGLTGLVAGPGSSELSMLNQQFMQREQGTGNREQWEELEFLGIKLI
jgi:hypothetical protein